MVEKNTPAKLMVEIWNHSMHKRTLSDKKNCNSQHYINRCIVMAKKQWSDDSICFKIAVYHFRFHKKELFEIMVEKDEDLLEQNVESYLRNK